MKPQFHQQNRKRLAETHDDGLILIFGSSAPYKNKKGYYGGALDRNFFYLTGLATSSSVLALWPDTGGPRERLFIEKPDSNEEKWSGIRMQASQAAELSGVADIAYLSELDEFLNDTLTRAAGKTLYLDIPSWFVEDVPPPIYWFIERTKKRRPGIDIQSVTETLATMRTVKQPEEIACIRDAVGNAHAGIEAMMKAIHPGMYEYQLQAVCHNLLFESGEMRSTPMVAAAGNAVILHYPEANARIGDDDLVLIDFCPRSKQYASDISRAFPAGGRFTPRQRELYSIALEANKRLIAELSPGTTFPEMNHRVRDFLAEGMKAVGLIRDRSEIERYYYHSVTHFVGLGIHDVGDGEKPIPAGSVLVVDAGVYVAEEGIGLRVEDDVLITPNGCENLSASIPKEIEDIEALMATS